MIILFAIAALAASTAHPPSCPVAEAHATSGMIDAHRANGFRTLDREPPAQAYLTVSRKIDRCSVPIIVPSVLTRGR